MSSATKRKPATSAPGVSTSSSVAALAGKIGAPIVSLVSIGAVSAGVDAIVIAGLAAYALLLAAAMIRKR